MIIDGTDLMLGRCASVVAEKALLGETVDIVNCEKIVISGSKDQVLARFKQKRSWGVPLQGPYIKRSPIEIVKRSIRGMLPYKQGKGKDAFARIKCYKGVPQRFQGASLETIKDANVSKLPNLKYISIEKISKFLGSKK